MSLSNGSDQKLDILIGQVGRLTEGLTEIRVTIQDQAEITRRQSESIDRLFEFRSPHSMTEARSV